ITGTSPPGPHRCGSTTCKAKAVATPASKALPPRSRMAIPTAVPIQCVVATTPKVPSSSGRVVKGPALILGLDIAEAPIAVASPEAPGRQPRGRAGQIQHAANAAELARLCGASQRCNARLQA